MNELTAEWIVKAEGDFITSGRETRARKHPNYDAACFHAQQSAEKYLKAFLQTNLAAFPKTHNLIELLELCLSLDPDFEIHRDILIRLDQYAVRYRYPGDSADKDEAQIAYQTINKFRQFMRGKLNLDKEP